MSSISNNKGMATIEACVIIPITLIVVMLLVWLGIFFYNKNVMSHAASRAAIMGGQHPEMESEELTEYMIAKVREMLEGKMIFMEDPSIEVSMDYSVISIKITGNMGLPGSVNMGGIYRKRAWEIALVEKAARIHPSIFVRTVSRVRNGLMGDNTGEGVNEGQ